MPLWHLGLALLGVAAYAVGSHALMVSYAHEPWAVAALLGPLLLVGAGVALRQRQKASIAAAVCAAIGLGVLVARGGVGDVDRLYVLQHAGIHAALACSFAASLYAPGLSAIGRLAAQLHPLTPAMVAYTRGVTIAWVAYFVGMAGLSVAVYAWAPWDVWSLLANIGTPLAMAAMFVGEHRLRYRLHPEFERTGLLEAVRAWRGTAASAPPAR